MQELSPVTKEQAIKLKILGFNWPVEKLYLDEQNTLFDDGNVYHPDNHNAYGDKTYSAPPILLAYKWLRKEKSIYIHINSDFSDSNNIVHKATVQNELFKVVKETAHFDWEDAERNGLQIALEYLLIQNM